MGSTLVLDVVYLRRVSSSLWLHVARRWKHPHFVHTAFDFPHPFNRSSTSSRFILPPYLQTFAPLPHILCRSPLVQSRITPKLSIMDSTANPSFDGETHTPDRGMPCLFPSFGRRPNAANSRKVSSARVNFERADTLVSLMAIDPDGLGALLRTAWALLLGCYTGQDDVSFGFQLIGNGPGYSISTRLRLDDSASVAQMLSHAKAQLATRDANPASRPQPGSPDSFDTAIVLWFLTQLSTPFQAPVPVRIAFIYSPRRRTTARAGIGTRCPSSQP